MAHDCVITQRLLRRQKTMFRLAEYQFGLTHKAIEYGTGISPSAIGQYARGETTMGGAAIMKLAEWRDFPAELLSMLFGGTGRLVCDEPQSPDHDQFAGAALDFASAHAKARHPEGECGVEIGPNEDRNLTVLAMKVKAA